VRLSGLYACVGLALNSDRTADLLSPLCLSLFVLMPQETGISGSLRHYKCDDECKEVGHSTVNPYF